MKIIKYISLVILVWTCFSCEEDSLMIFNSDTRLKFRGRSDTLVHHTFVFESQSVKKDTVFVSVYTMGNLSGEDRPIRIEQVEEKELIYKTDENGNKIDSSFVNISNSAVPGVHYIGLNDAEISKHMVVKANEISAKIPIVLLRDASLKQASYRLRIRIFENEYFKLGEKHTLETVIVVSDNFEKPKYWLSSSFGVYGQEKHKFMVDVSGLRIDDDFFKRIRPSSAERFYYKAMFQRALDKYNAEHPDKPLREKPRQGQIEGDLVIF